MPYKEGKQSRVTRPGASEPPNPGEKPELGLQSREEPGGGVPGRTPVVLSKGSPG